MIKVEVGQGKNNFWVASGEMIEVAVDQDLVLEQVPMEIELDFQVLGILPLCQRLSKHVRDRKNQTDQMQQMLDSEDHKTTLKVLAADTYKVLIIPNSEETMDHLNS